VTELVNLSSTTTRTLRDVVDRWRSEQRHLAQLGAQVDAASLIGQILDDVEGSTVADANEELSLPSAAAESGYSSNHLSRLVRDGRIPNAGRPGAPRIRRADLPRKPPPLRTDRSRVQLLGAGPGQVARAIVATEKGAQR
jgi:hypothetical protein